MNTLNENNVFNQTLFKIHSSGKVGDWEIEVLDLGDGTASMVRHSRKVLGGTPVVTETHVKVGKNIGRSNETTPLEQAVNEAKAKVQNQLDKGYVVDMPKAGDVVTNSLGFLKPMLAQPIEKVKKWSFPVFAQRKFDGHRMLATVQDNRVVLYSRQGKEQDVAHIREALEKAYDNGIWDGKTLDGEIYQHGETLQRISSLVKKPKPESLGLTYWLYDIMEEAQDYSQRLAQLEVITSQLDFEKIQLTDTMAVDDDDALNAIHSQFLSEGYEGTIVRHGNNGYEGKRSMSLMKKKDFQDAEFEIVDVNKGKPYIKPDGTYEMAIYTCVTSDGVQFEATAPGTMQEKHNAWEARFSAIGKMLTVKYFNMTPNGAPFLPVALRLREDI